MFYLYCVHLGAEPNRFQRMELSHPKQYDYCINSLGYDAVMDLIHIPYAGWTQEDDLHISLEDDWKV